ncbi:condensin complex subunit [Anaeramoeba flamelloides]|uniref:Condensin complex subunit 2 n=1 Tax=Anaeramoeba flamelloides TaxID=1746091 RepID=A0AAV8A7G4_9EUKA|nr:condensin complex subunit [Anaeramoeba flamelloides]
MTNTKNVFEKSKTNKRRLLKQISDKLDTKEINLFHRLCIDVCNGKKFSQQQIWNFNLRNSFQEIKLKKTEEVNFAIESMKLSAYVKLYSQRVESVFKDINNMLSKLNDNVKKTKQVIKERNALLLKNTNRTIVETKKISFGCNTLESIESNITNNKFEDHLLFENYKNSMINVRSNIISKAYLLFNSRLMNIDNILQEEKTSSNKIMKNKPKETNPVNILINRNLNKETSLEINNFFDLLDKKDKICPNFQIFKENNWSKFFYKKPKKSIDAKEYTPKISKLKDRRDTGYTDEKDDFNNISFNSTSDNFDFSTLKEPCKSSTLKKNLFLNDMSCNQKNFQFCSFNNLSLGIIKDLKIKNLIQDLDIKENLKDPNIKEKTKRRKKNWLKNEIKIDFYTKKIPHKKLFQVTQTNKSTLGENEIYHHNDESVLLIESIRYVKDFYKKLFNHNMINLNKKYPFSDWNNRQDDEADLEFWNGTNGQDIEYENPNNNISQLKLKTNDDINQKKQKSVNSQENIKSKKNQLIPISLLKEIILNILISKSNIKDDDILSFSDLIQLIKLQLSKNSITIQLIFIALLHLVNEYELKLMKTSKLNQKSEIQITFLNSQSKKNFISKFL